MVEKFPVFLKTLSGGNYYCIWSEVRMEEWQRIGSKGVRWELNAITMPDRWVILDILQNTQGNYEAISEEEWRAVTESLK